MSRHRQSMWLGVVLTAAAGLHCAGSASHRRADVVRLGMRIDGRSQLTQDENGVPHVRVAYSNTRLAWRTLADTIWICAQELLGPEARVQEGLGSEYDLLVDGVALPMFHAPQQARCTAVARGLGPGPHEVVLTKRTEPSVGETLFSRPEGPLEAPPAPKTRVLLAVGDSITCGYGVLCPDAGKGLKFDPRDEDGTQSYVAQAARALSAATVVVAYSGHGVWRNRDNTFADTLPSLFAQALPSDAAGRTRPARADAVVVNVGTNDLAPGPLDWAAFERHYRALLALTDADSPWALTVLAFGPMVGNKAEMGHETGVFRQVVAWLEGMARQRSARGRRTVVLALPPQDEPPFSAMGLGCHYHPNLAVQAAMGRRLEAVLKRELSW